MGSWLFPISFQLCLILYYVKKSSLHGYGVFADKNIKKGELIEECYVILCTGHDRKLEDYYFDADRRYAILTGFGVIYNHADEPNADYKIKPSKNIINFIALKDIEKDTEITTNYNHGTPKDKSPLWFGVK